MYDVSWSCHCSGPTGHLDYVPWWPGILLLPCPSLSPSDCRLPFCVGLWGRLCGVGSPGSLVSSQCWWPQSSFSHSVARCFHVSCFLTLSISGCFYLEAVVNTLVSTTLSEFLWLYSWWWDCWSTGWFLVPALSSVMYRPAYIPPISVEGLHFLTSHLRCLLWFWQ